MTTTLREKIRKLPDLEKLALVDDILVELDRPDPGVDRLWAEESHKRWAAYKAGRVRTVPYSRIVAKYRTHED